MATAVFLSVRDKATRLPGKVLKEIAGKPVIVHLMDRLKQASGPDLMVMTTSTNADDSNLAELAKANGFECFRGSEDDKLQRYLDAAAAFSVEFAAIVDGDDLFCEPTFVDRVVSEYHRSGADYIVCKDVPLGATPFGVRIEALRRVCELKAGTDTEVWGGYFTETGRFRCVELEVDERYRRPEVRMTLDYPEDLAFFEAIYHRLYDGTHEFGMEEVLALLEEHPEIAEINRSAQARYEAGIERAQKVVEEEDLKRIASEREEVA